MTVINDYHRRVLRWLAAWGVQYQEEYPVGPYSIDVYLPEMRIGLELDGPWHNRKRDAVRDEIISGQGIDILRVKVGTPKAQLWEILLSRYEVEHKRRTISNGHYNCR